MPLVGNTVQLVLGIGSLTGTPAAGATSTTLTIKYQGCADAGVCYPPQTRTLKVAINSAELLMLWLKRP